MGVLITLETKIGDVEGMINFFIPYLTLEPIMGKLISPYWFTTKKGAVTLGEATLNDVLVIMKAEYFRIKCMLGEIANFKAGDVLFAPEQNPYTGRVFLNDTSIGCFKLLETTEKKKIEIIDKQYYKEKNFMEEKLNASYKDAGLNDIMIRISVELGKKTGTLREVKEYREGSIIELDEYAGEPAYVFANNVMIARAEVVVIDEHFDVRLTEVMNKKEQEDQKNEENQKNHEVQENKNDFSNLGEQLKKAFEDKLGGELYDS
jgi:flagellar motor switch protein FliN